MFEFDGSPAEYMTWTEDRLGPLVTAKAALGERWPELRAKLVAITEEANEATDGSVRMPAQYLIRIGRK